jgi:hypothetical protein
LGQEPIGRGDDPHVDFERPGPPHSLELSVLQDSQQLGLDFLREIADLIQENRPSIG